MNKAEEDKQEPLKDKSDDEFLSMLLEDDKFKQELWGDVWES